jgi:hypothetical protein
VSELGDKFKSIVRSQGRRSDLAKRDKLPPMEREALRKIRREARAAGSFLTSGGKGGLPPSLVLGAFRKAKWRCKACGELGSKENQGLGIHHKFQHITAPEERDKGVRAIEEGRRNDPSQIAVVCGRCHDKIHQRDRAENGGEDADDVVDEARG